MTTAARRLSQLSGALNANGIVPTAQVVSHTHVGGGLTKLTSQTIQVTQTAIAHGLAGTPTVVIVVPRGVSFVYESAVADTQNVYLTAAGITTCDIYVAI
jgi:hypothetical protein